MTIILSAFGRLYSKPMEIPEGSGFQWKMALVQPLTRAITTMASKAPDKPTFPAMCVFEWTGHYVLSEGTRCMEYVLTDITK